MSFFSATTCRNFNLGEEKKNYSWNRKKIVLRHRERYLFTKLTRNPEKQAGRL